MAKNSNNNNNNNNVPKCRHGITTVRCVMSQKSADLTPVSTGHKYSNSCFMLHETPHVPGSDTVRAHAALDTPSDDVQSRRRRASRLPVSFGKAQRSQDSGTNYMYHWL
jgi:hypothetical protein